LRSSGAAPTPERKRIYGASATSATMLSCQRQNRSSRDLAKMSHQKLTSKCPKFHYIFRTGNVCALSEKQIQISDKWEAFFMSDASARIMSLITTAGPAVVWVPTDFAHIGSRYVVDKTLQRLVSSGQLRRIDRGLYDLPAINRLMRRPTVPDYLAVVNALARRDQLRFLVDGMTAANDLGLTDAVPARVTFHTDARRRSIQLDNLVIDFRHTAPSRLYWAGRPAMRVVQALHWLKDTLPGDADRIRQRLHTVLTDPKQGRVIIRDLIEGFSNLPAWMQEFLRATPGFDPNVDDADIVRSSGSVASTSAAPFKRHSEWGSR
jgi:hypothetical protein